MARALPDAVRRLGQQDGLEPLAGLIEQGYFRTAMPCEGDPADA